MAIAGFLGRLEVTGEPLNENVLPFVLETARWQVRRVRRLREVTALGIGTLGMSPSHRFHRLTAQGFISQLTHPGQWNNQPVTFEAFTLYTSVSMKGSGWLELYDFTQDVSGLTRISLTITGTPITAQEEFTFSQDPP